MRRIIKWSGISLAALFASIQIIRPEQDNPVSDPAKHIQVQMRLPDNVSSILIRACYDCHSNQTVWPWYSKIAPVSWIITDDVNHGRKHLNFSEWGDYNKTRQGKKLSQIAEEVSEKNMPLGKYIFLHAEADLSDQDRRLLIHWAEGEFDKSDTTGTADDDDHDMKK